MDSEKIHVERCARDPMYHLCYFPTKGDFQRQLLDKCIQIIHKKYGSAIRDDALIQRIFRLLNEYNDPQAMFLALMFIMVWETDVSKAMGELFDVSQDYTLHGNASREHYRKFLQTANGYVENTLQFPYNKTNILETTKKFKEACVLAYMTQ